MRTCGRVAWGLGMGLLLATLPMLPAVAMAMAPATARQIAPLDIGFPEPSGFFTSPDGRWLALLHLPGEKGSDCSLFERRTHRLTTLKGASRLEPLVFSRDGRRLIVWGYNAYEPLRGLRRKPSTDFFLAVYDLRRHRFTHTITDMKHDLGVVTASALSRNGRVLTVVSDAGWLSAYNLQSGRLKFRHRVLNKGDEPVTVPLSGDGKRLMAIEDWEMAGVSCQRSAVVSARTGRVLCALWLRYPKPGAAMPAYSGGEFSPDGRLAATFFAGTQEWFFFNARNGRRLWKMGGPSRTSEGDLVWRFSLDGRRVGVCGPHGFEVRAARTGRVLWRGARVSTASVVTWSPDGKLVYTIEKGDAFEGDSVLWQWRIFGTAREKREDRLIMARLRREKERFALSPRHINESLIQAARQGDPARVSFLLSHGAYLETRDRQGATPLSIAAFGMDIHGGPKKFVEVVRLLLARGAQVNTHTKQQDTPLTSAATGSYTITNMLLEHGADVNGRTFEGSTALSQAAGFNHPAIIKLLIEHGAAVNTRDNEGSTPLMNAVDWGWAAGVMDAAEERAQLLIVKMLLAHGANVNARDKNGRTALMNAQSPAVVRVLRAAGAK